MSMAAGPSGLGSRSREGQNYPRRSLRISPTELVRRENALADAERDLELQKEELALKLEAHKEQQKESAIVLAEHDALTTLSHLDEHFQCPLCYEVAATPYTVSSPDCGHTFCAICILKWFFSRLHPPCGSWHEAVDCPICRARFVYTPDAPPREADTFPFVPNRLATTVITAFIEKIGSHPVNTAMHVKKEEEEVMVSGSKRAGGRKCSRKTKEEEMEEDEKPRTSAIDAWKEGGALRTEWLRKEREGRQEMTRLHGSWRVLRSMDFVETKRRLGV
ncbi:hypothetical protein BKA70DRAFT_1418837 [Coprinopsis sp. MPI-PUGE-AT-0042]|nr:hypothetical protein BKA70DRAFT_1418837 [Coprinopsis sp. MPI-PUGE-AT-0042]